MTSCPKEMVLRIWGFWKDISWGWPLMVAFEIIGSDQITSYFLALDRQRCIEILNITRCAAIMDGVQHSIVCVGKSLRKLYYAEPHYCIVSLSLCNQGPKPEIVSEIVSETTEFTCICICICITVVIEIFMAIRQFDPSSNALNMARPDYVTEWYDPLDAKVMVGVPYSRYIYHRISWFFLCNSVFLFWLLKWTKKLLHSSPLFPRPLRSKF